MSPSILAFYTNALLGASQIASAFALGYYTTRWVLSPTLLVSDVRGVFRFFSRKKTNVVTWCKEMAGLKPSPDRSPRNTTFWGFKQLWTRLFGSTWVSRSCGVVRTALYDGDRPTFGFLNLLLNEPKIIRQLPRLKDEVYTESGMLDRISRRFGWVLEALYYSLPDHVHTIFQDLQIGLHFCDRRTLKPCLLFKGTNFRPNSLACVDDILAYSSIVDDREYTTWHLIVLKGAPDPDNWKLDFERSALKDVLIHGHCVNLHPMEENSPFASFLPM